jgi:prevent-host-death family protein
METISKSRFKPRALEYVRAVQESGVPLVITEHGRPVLRIVPYRLAPRADIEALRGSILRYDDPIEPVGAVDWEATDDPGRVLARP